MITTAAGNKLGKHAPKPVSLAHHMAARQLLAQLPPAPPTRDWLAPVSFPAGIMGNDTLGCHDAETEVLTDKGWQRWPSYDGSPVATMSQMTGILEYQRPTALIRYDYDGELVFADHKSLDFGLTPNHRMYNRPYLIPKPYVAGVSGYAGKYQFDEIRSLPHRVAIPAAPTGHVGAELESIRIGDRSWDGDDFMALVALVLSDGWAGDVEGSNPGAISFCSFVEKRRDMVASFAHRLGISEIPGRHGVWKFTDRALSQWFYANGCVDGVFKSKSKRIPRLVHSATEAQQEVFLRYFGHQAHASEDQQFYSSSKAMIDDLQELLLLTGKRGGIYEQQAGGFGGAPSRDGAMAYTLTVRKTDRVTVLANGKKGNLRGDHYRGEVFCVEVPNSTLITRRNGSVLVSGNCCTASGIGHWIQVATANNGAEVTPSDADVVKFYSGSTGYNPADPSTDQGGVEADVLAYAKKVGMGGFKIDGFAAAQAQNLPQMQQIVNTFGGAYIGLALPKTIEAQGEYDGATWDVDLSAGADAERGSLGGHCVIVEKYDGRGFWILTWGIRIYLTNDFMAGYNDEAWAMLANGLWAPKGITPAGDAVPAYDGFLAAVA
jgi:hypothetical protein